ncbi:TFIIB-type zinc ribbon-containing protein, partial [Halorhabdus amylolytica]|uniref:TFIIB-type zinc ribbon-containing protein n=1 Tax=Halorhabdus amylolytica TaxID=2559573 RepID=UPI0024A69F52
MSETTTPLYTREGTSETSKDERERAEGVEEVEHDEHEQCPECGGKLSTDEERGETVCSECGLVVEEDEIDPGPEWRAFDAKEKDQKSRVGAPTTNMMHDKGLST